MKKLFMIPMMALAATVCCGQTDAETSEKKGNNVLVVYFSMPETVKAAKLTRDEENSVVVIEGRVMGNTQYVANLIKEYTGGDLYRIESEKSYPLNHKILVDMADKEKQENARPKLKSKVKNLDRYDTVFIGYPIWWGDMPMILYSFFDAHDLSGKTIIPFITHGGSGFGDTINSIAKLEPKAKVERNGYSVYRDNIQQAKTEIISWLVKKGY